MAPKKLGDSLRSTTNKDYWGSGEVSIVFDPSPCMVPWRWTVVGWSQWFLWPFWRCELSLFSLIYIHSRTLCYNDTALVLNRHLHSFTGQEWRSRESDGMAEIQSRAPGLLALGPVKKSPGLGPLGGRSCAITLPAHPPALSCPCPPPGLEWTFSRSHSAWSLTSSLPPPNQWSELQPPPAPFSSVNVSWAW